MTCNYYTNTYKVLTRQSAISKWPNKWVLFTQSHRLGKLVPINTIKFFVLSSGLRCNAFANYFAWTLNGFNFDLSSP